MSKGELILKYEAAKEADKYWNSRGRHWMNDRWVNNLLSACTMTELNVIKEYLNERIQNAQRVHQRDSVQENYTLLD